MKLKIDSKLIVVCGAIAGFGKSVAKLLLEEGENIIAIARGEE